MTKEPIELPSPASFMANGAKEAFRVLFNDSLYSPSDLNSWTYYHLRSAEFKGDGYCIFCKRESIFVHHDQDQQLTYHRFSTRRAPNESALAEQAWAGTVTLHCQRDRFHTYTFHVRCVSGTVEKIGQYPSAQSIAASDVAKYRSMLPKEDYDELQRAGGLIAHNIGIGSYVYLRRVFERMIARHHAEYAKERGEIDGFGAMPMDQKVEALAAVLPSTVRDFPGMYGFLSKGLHELSEEFCKKHFPLLRSMILTIVEEDYHQEQKALTAKTMRDEFARAKGEATALKDGNER